MQCVASGDVKICRNAKTRKVPDGKAKSAVIVERYTGIPRDSQVPPGSIQNLEAPAALRRLFCGVDITAREFRDKVCSYNNAFAFTSLGVKIDHVVTSAAGPYSFRIHGGLHHSISAFHPPEATMLEIQDTLGQFNPFIPLYKQAYQIIMEKPEAECANITAHIALIKLWTNVVIIFLLQMKLLLLSLEMENKMLMSTVILFCS
ncbi:hypothetical protein SERLA73DRAFT_151426 [Serpula lacrymans var. lacrymans S7.3]|uniref:Uncharacterized protein n=1 Tax=Serpula lacrymans var. lacrymans (strain S7.3) TaxID=936435 RepID=F8PSJ5_SERL3|nr:hypothetical protein SERLA73DRAFT_151426 [Serpula lacrymans var. lacrymans S7.3]